MNTFNKPLRVLLLTETYAPEIGGGERQAYLLARGLVARGHPVTIVTRRSRERLPWAETADGIRVLRLPPTGRGRWRKWGLLLPALAVLLWQRRQYDVVLVSGFRLLGISALLARQLTRKPTVLKADSGGEFSGEYFQAGLVRSGLSPDSGFVRQFVRLRNTLLRRANAFVALSQEMNQELIDHGVPAEHIHRIANGVDTELFRPASSSERAELRQRLGQLTGPIVVFTGRLVSYKGVPGLVRAWCGVLRRVPTATLVLVGEGGNDIHACERQLRDFVAAQHLTTSVRFTGAVENVQDWLRAADVFAFPTENEAFGLSLVEAMSCALPVVTTTVGGLRDFIVPGVNALVVPCGNEHAINEALQSLLHDSERAHELGQAARQTVLRLFSAEVVTEAYIALFKSLSPTTAAS